MGILSILSLQECGMCCHHSKPERYDILRQCSAVKFCKCRGKLIHHLIAEIQGAEGCTHFKNLLKKVIEALCGRSLTHLYLRMKSRS